MSELREPVIGRDELEEVARLAEEVAREAGALLLRNYDRGMPSTHVSGSASTKSTRTDLVTEADNASERLIVDRLRAERPGDGVLAEEGNSHRGTSGLTFVVDPLDGTVNFVYGFPAFAVSIGYESVAGARQHNGEGERLVGVVYDPLRDEAFVAVRGAGAKRDGQPLRLTSPPPLEEALVGTGFGYDAGRRLAQAELLETVLPAVRDLRRAGAAALDLCWLAAGRLDAYFEAGLAPWDLSAGSLVVTEAGGAIDLVEGLVPGVATAVAAAPRLQRELVALLLRARAEANRRTR